MATTNYNLADITRLPDNATRYQQDSEIIDVTNANNVLIDTALQSLESSKLTKTGDVKDTTVTFTESTIRENLVSGDKSSVLMGKIKKWFTDIWTTLSEKADKIWMADNWKTESDSPSSYPSKTKTIFCSSETWNGLTGGCIVETTAYNLNIIRQEVSSYDGNPLMYRLSRNGWGTWQPWKSIATTDKIDILSTDLLNGWTQTFPHISTTIGISGNIVNLNGWLTVGNIATNTVVFNIPYHPSEFRVVFVACSDGKVRQLNINTAGDVAVDGTFIPWTTGLHILLNSSFII